MKFSEVADEYIKYMRKKYGSIIVIVDGCNKTTSLNSHENARRYVSKGRNIVIKVESLLSYSKACFLFNANNKSELITLLAERFAEDDQKVYVCVGDAESKSVEAVGVAKSAEVIVISDDSNVAIMLLFQPRKKSEMLEY